jgi:hypothetical protein
MLLSLDVVLKSPYVTTFIHLHLNALEGIANNVPGSKHFKTLFCKTLDPLSSCGTVVGKVDMPFSLFALHLWVFR